MKDISVFDVIGPIMIGPSSSHTAGALKIALMAGKIAAEPVREAHFILYGSFAKTYKGHGTDRALVGGILGFRTDDPRIRDSFAFAEKAGLRFSFSMNETERDVHPNTVDVLLSCESGKKVTVRGVSTGGGNCRLENINGISVDLTGNYTTLLIRQRDAFGVVAHITSCLSEYRVNIAYMRLYRESRGKAAYTIIETDDDISAEITRRIETYPDIESAMLLKI